MIYASIKDQQNAILEEAPIPQPQEDEIVVKVACALTSENDRRAWASGADTAIGSAISGTVHAVGAKVSKFEVGQEIMCARSGSCHKCGNCLRQREHYCDSFDKNAIQHGLAQYALLSADVTEYSTFAKPDSLSFAKAAFLEPMSQVMHGLRQLTIHPDDTIVILGGGTLGLLYLLAIKATAQPQSVILVSTKQQHLEIASRIGADYADYMVNPSEENLQEAIMRYTNGYGAQIVIDCAGTPEVWESMLGLASKAATLLFSGGFSSGYKLQLDTTRVHYDQMTLIGACNYSSEDVAEAQRLLASGEINTQHLISGTLPLSEINSAFRKLTADGAITFAITPNGNDF
ncbi:zinc-binding dehydrogenase [bacterium]|nr:zinc-binding dehydrogenase [bacterium]